MNGLELNYTFIMDADDITQEPEWTIEKIVRDRPPYGWKELFSQPGILAAAKHIDEILKRKRNGVYLPLKRDLFRAYYNTPLDMVKVIIIGQDPYPGIYPDGMPHATGMSFSLRRNAPLQPSLRNIYKEIQRTTPGFVPPNHGDLTGWTQQGVFLLNAALTTAPREKNADPDIWNGFITQTLAQVREKRGFVVVLLWGRPAQAFAKLCGSLRIITCAHPASENYGRQVEDPFIGSNCFTRANLMLGEKGISPIDWTRLD